MTLQTLCPGRHVLFGHLAPVGPPTRRDPSATSDGQGQRSPLGMSPKTTFEPGASPSKAAGMAVGVDWLSWDEQRGYNTPIPPAGPEPPSAGTFGVPKEYPQIAGARKAASRMLTEPGGGVCVLLPLNPALKPTKALRAGRRQIPALIPFRASLFFPSCWVQKLDPPPLSSQRGWEKGPGKWS